MKVINMLWCLFLMTQLIAQNPEIEILKSESGNEVTYYAKSNVRDFLTVEVAIEGTGFTTSVPLPVKADLASYEKKELVKITLDPSGKANYGISYKYYKKVTKQATNLTPKTNSSSESVSESLVTRPDLDKGIVIFSKDGCGKCAYAIKYMKEKNLAYNEINISANEADKKLMWDTLLSNGFSGASVQTPVIMVDGKVHYNMDIKTFMAELKP